MEALGVLVVLSLAGILFGLPVAAFINSKRALRRFDALENQLSELRTELVQLKRAQNTSASGPRPESAPGPATSVAPPAIPTAASRAVEPSTSATPPLLEPVLAESMAAPTIEPSRAPPAEPIPVLPRMAPPPINETAPAPPKETRPRFNWEQFMGAKLFAWLGGFALFLGVAYFIKYSFERNLIPPEVRVALGFLTGIGLLIAGVVLRRKAYAVTSQTFCATGVVVLYAVTFACRSLYHFAFFGVIPTFLLMGLITITACLLAVRLDALVVAILGMLGGFLTPALLSTGQDNPLGLFGYIAVLDIGIMAVALARRWAFLVLLAAIGTVLMQFGWAAKFFAVPKIFIALTVFLGFDLLFLLGFFWAKRLQQAHALIAAAAAGLAFATLAFTGYLLTYPDLGQRPGIVFAFVLGGNLALLTLAMLDAKLTPLHLASGGAAFLLLAGWTMRYLDVSLLNWGLAFYLIFAVLHAVFPIVRQRLRPGPAPVWWGHLFPPLALLLVMLPMFKLSEASFFIWPVVLLLDVLAIVLAVLTASLLSVLIVLLLTLGATLLWMMKVPAELTRLPELLLLIGGFAVFFFVVGIFLLRRVLPRLELDSASSAGGRLFRAATTKEWITHLPALAATLPFLLLIMATLRLPLANPSPVFGLALLLVVLLLGVARAMQVGALPAVALGCMLALEFVWHERHFSATTTPLLALGWYLLFFALFALFPFVFRQRMGHQLAPWIAAALAGPLHFVLVHRLVQSAFPNSYMGLLPAAFTLPSLASLLWLSRRLPSDHAHRQSLLAWFGGVALFFITLVFPIQFDRQWITLGWALEGAALLWFYHRVPHPGLRLTGVALLLVSFARLALNPAVLSYHPRSAAPILNWYLYAYGVVTVCLFVGARLLAPPRNKLLGHNAPPILNALGTVLAFLLLNIEIADYFTGPGQAALTFEFSGNFARDMTYTIAWALFALALLVAGLACKLRSARYAALGLLGVTLLKLFFHDLARLDNLYRIGALIAVAVIAILASFLYQKFLSHEKPPELAPGAPPPAQEHPQGS